MNRSRLFPRSRGVTVLELLIGVATIAVIAALLIPALSGSRAHANQTACLSNQRQIGLAIILYANDHQGYLPATTHSTGRRYNRATGTWSNEEAWISVLSPYLADVDEIRVCPADPPARRNAILALKTKPEKATSYILNDLVFDSETYSRLLNIPFPSRTLLMGILTEDKAVSATWDHAHAAEWTQWQFLCNDIEVDRHRSGVRAANRLKGSSNYLYADGHAANISASEMKRRIDSGINPGAVPTDP